MSLIRALSKDLEARSDESLRALFAARPDGSACSGHSNG
jgi:hypothetical protein